MPEANGGLLEAGVALGEEEGAPSRSLFGNGESGAFSWPCWRLALIFSAKICASSDPLSSVIGAKIDVAGLRVGSAEKLQVREGAWRSNSSNANQAEAEKLALDPEEPSSTVAVASYNPSCYKKPHAAVTVAKMVERVASSRDAA